MAEFVTRDNTFRSNQRINRLFADIFKKNTQVLLRYIKTASVLEYCKNAAGRFSSNDNSIITTEPFRYFIVSRNNNFI